jgi:Protein of unknown function (DUF3105)
MVQATHTFPLWAQRDITPADGTHPFSITAWIGIIPMDTMAMMTMSTTDIIAAIGTMGIIERKQTRRSTTTKTPTPEEEWVSSTRQTGCFHWWAMRCVRLRSAKDYRGISVKEKKENQEMGRNQTRMKEKATGTARVRNKREQQRRRRLMTRTAWIACGFVLFAGIVIGGFVLLRGQASGPGTIAGITTFANLKRDHQTGPLTYPQSPPVGGPHNPTWQNCGIYSSALPNENAVHSLEHGAVWIIYQPTLEPSAIERLKSLVRGKSYALLSPYPGSPAPIVMSAWGTQLRVDQADDPRLGAFLTQYMQGPQTPEPGAACTGGNGTPEE